MSCGFGGGGLTSGACTRGPSPAAAFSASDAEGAEGGGGDRDLRAGLPLALVQAGKMVKEKRLSFAAYRERFERRRLALFANAPTAPSGTHREEQSVHTIRL